MSWTRRLGRLAHLGLAEVEEEFDEMVERLRTRLGRWDPVMIQPYRGFGTPDEFWLQGRVLENEGIPEAGESDSVLRNLFAMALRFETDEVPETEVTATAGLVEARTRTDEEGYFEFRLRPEPSASAAEDGWSDVLLQLPAFEQDGEPVQATGRVLVPHPGARFGVISDIDDTVLESGATSLLSLARATLLNNVHSRKPFEGVAAFYRALERGSGTNGAMNPFFYVSSSPWNLYDFIEEFFVLHDLPMGPLLLRDLGLDETTFIKSGHEHKLEKIERILATYPDLPFVLVGDSGQEDPEMYRRAIDDFPGRIRVIYIRDVSDDVRDEEVARLADEARRQDIEMVLVPDSAAAAEHAAALDLIPREAIPGILADRAKDESGQAARLLHERHP